MLQVSKTPVREALLRLCHVGLVEPTTRGLRVVLPNSTSIRNAYEVRTGLETMAAELAASRATDEQRAEIIAAAANSLQYARAEDAEGFARWDRAFHVSVAAGERQRPAGQAVEDSVILAFTLRSRDVMTLDDSVRCGRHHVSISKTIKKGDGGAGQQADAGAHPLGHPVRAHRGQLSPPAPAAGGYAVLQGQPRPPA